MHHPRLRLLSGQTLRAYDCCAAELAGYAVDVAHKTTAIMGFLDLIIRNDAMKTDPHEIYGWRVYAIACSV